MMEVTRNGDWILKAEISNDGLWKKEHSSTSWWRARNMSTKCWRRLILVSSVFTRIDVMYCVSFRLSNSGLSLTLRGAIEWSVTVGDLAQVQVTLRLRQLRHCGLIPLHLVLFRRLEESVYPPILTFHNLT